MSIDLQENSGEQVCRVCQIKDIEISESEKKEEQQLGGGELWRGAEKLLLIGQHVIKKARNNVEYHRIKSLGGGEGRNQKMC